MISELRHQLCCTMVPSVRKRRLSLPAAPAMRHPGPAPRRRPLPGRTGLV